MKVWATTILLIFGLLGAWVRALAAATDETKPVKTLGECVEIAMQHHPSIKAAVASAEAGQKRIHEAASAYLPQLNALYRATRQNTSLTARVQSGVQVKSQTFNFFTTGVSFTQILFDFGQTFNLIRSAQASEESLQADLTTQRDTVVLNVKQSYFNVLAARQLLGVANDTMRQNQKHLEQAQGRFHVGLAPKFDVTNSEVQVANAELNQLTARNNVAVAWDTLRNALGINGPLDFDIADVGQRPVSITEEEALAIAYDNRPELQSIRAQELAENEQIKAL